MLNPNEWQIPNVAVESKTIGGGRGDLELRFEMADNVCAGLNGAQIYPTVR